MTHIPEKLLKEWDNYKYQCTSCAEELIMIKDKLIAEVRHLKDELKGSAKDIRHPWRSGYETGFNMAKEMMEKELRSWRK